MAGIPKRVLLPLDAGLLWEIVHLIRPAWSAVDKLLFNNAGASNHVFLDEIISKLRSKNALHPHSFYPGGWGRVELLPTFARQLTATSAVREAHQRAIPAVTGSAFDALHNAAVTGDGYQPLVQSLVAAGYLDGATASTALSLVGSVPRVTPVLRRSSCHGRSYAHVLDGTFPCPMGVASDSATDPVDGSVMPLPPQSATASFQLVVPTSWLASPASGAAAASSPPTTTAAVGATPRPPSSSSSVAATSSEMRDQRPLVIILPGTGEQGFTRRRQCVAYPLARLGVASLVLEGPYYGSRKPPSQVASKLRTVLDLCVLGRATIEEARCLAQWAREDLSLADLVRAIASGNAAAGAPTPRAPPSPRSQPLPAGTVADGRSAPSGPPAGVAEALQRADPATSYDSDDGADGDDAYGRGSWKQRRGGADNHLLDVSDVDTMKIAQEAATAAAFHQHHDQPQASAQATAPRAAGGAGRVAAFRHIVFAGTSMGGLHSAMSASLSPFPAGVASWLGPPSAAPVFSVGALSHSVDWPALATHATLPHLQASCGEADVAAADADCAPVLGPAVADVFANVREMDRVLDAASSFRHGFMGEVRAAAAQAMGGQQPKPPGAATAAARAAAAGAAASPTHTTAPSHSLTSEWAMRLLMARILRITDLTNFAPPRLPSAAVFVHASHDRYVPNVGSTQAMWARVAATWDGADVRCVRGGHVSASLFGFDTYVGLIVEVIRRTIEGSSNSGGGGGGPVAGGRA